MRKKIYLVHCWSGAIEDGWYPWLKENLEKSNIEIIMENMPDTDEPKINEWVSKLDSLVNNLDENTYFIGHSIGCQAIMRYLETKEITKIGGILFVAPWLDLLPNKMDNESNKIAYGWINTPINFNKLKQFTNNIIAIFSTDDYYVSLEQEKLMKEKLDVKTVIVENKGHISAEDNIFELSDILIQTGRLLGLELIEVVDERENATGEILDKNIVHDRNLLHKEVGIFILNSNNELLIQKRSANKRFHPSKWGLCAGHVEAYESNISAALRELEEEVGVKANEEDLKLFDTVVKKRVANSHITYEYYMFLDKALKDFVIQTEELSEVKWIPFNKYKEMVVNNDLNITLSNNEDNLKMLDILEKILAKKD